MADDGAIHADWLAHHALRFARRSEQRRLRLLHAAEPAALPEDVIERRRRLAKRYGVELEVVEIGGRGGVADRLVAAVPAGPEQLLVVGMRTRAGHRGVLSGTVAAQLLARGDRQVLAIRVVRPCSLGLPGHAAVALFESAGLLDRLRPGLHALLPDLHRLTLICVMATEARLLARLSGAAHAEQLQQALIWLDGVAANLRRSCGAAAPAIDTRAAVASDWASQVLIEAARCRVNLLLLGTSPRTLPLRYDAGNPLERLVRDAPCDVALCAGGGR